MLFSRVLLKLWPIIRFQLDHFLHVSSIFVWNGSICPPCNRGRAVFSQVDPYYFPCFQEGHSSYVSPQVVLFILKQLSGAGIYCSTLKTIADLHFLGIMGLVKCQDVNIGLDSFFGFTSGNSSHV